MSEQSAFGPSTWGRVVIDRDFHVLGDRLIKPFKPENVQPASIDVALGGTVLVPMCHTPQGAPVDMRYTDLGRLYTKIPVLEGFVLQSGGCLLAATQERVTCPRNMIARIEGKSTLGRMFLTSHVTAGFIDPGFEGVITLEIVNHSPWSIVLYEGMLIAQISFFNIGMSVAKPYGECGSHYQGASGVEAPKAGASDGSHGGI